MGLNRKCQSVSKWVRNIKRSFLKRFVNEIKKVTGLLENIADKKKVTNRLYTAVTSVALAVLCDDSSFTSPLTSTTGSTLSHWNWHSSPLHSDWFCFFLWGRPSVGTAFSSIFLWCLWIVLALKTKAPQLITHNISSLSLEEWYIYCQEASSD